MEPPATPLRRHPLWMVPKGKFLHFLILKEARAEFKK